jgi:hypothetical protein
MCNWVNNKNKNNEEKGKIREEKSHDWDFVFVMVVTRFFEKIEDRKERQVRWENVISRY